MIKKITIEAVLNGFIVQCGCQTIVFTSRSHMICELDNYLVNPEAVTRRYMKESINAGVYFPPEAAPSPDDAEISD